jgi:class 3 adenylate cyclase
MRHGQSGDQCVVVSGQRDAVPPDPWPALAPGGFDEQMLKQWLLPSVYDRLKQGMGHFLTELRPTVALFVRFTGIDFDHDEDAGGKLDRFVRFVQRVTERHGGTFVDLNVGDKGSYLYINFGAPLTHENDADRAAYAALDLLAGAADFTYLEPLQIGISQGRMRAGAYGAAAHRTYGVLGDEVNMAARLMMAAASGQILVSDNAVSVGSAAAAPHERARGTHPVLRLAQPCRAGRRRARLVGECLALRRPQS